MSKFFIERPILANVIAIITVLLGLVCLFNLPVAQYPEVVPPTIQVKSVRAVAAGRIAATSIHQYLTGQAVTGEPAIAGIAMQPVDDAERAAIFRAIESAARVRARLSPLGRRRALLVAAMVVIARI